MNRNRLTAEHCTISTLDCEGTITEVLSVSRAKGAVSRHGTILLAQLTKGELKPGEVVTVSANHRKISDIVASIERNSKGIPYAVVGEPIGICLKTLRLGRIAKLL